MKKISKWIVTKYKAVLIGSIVLFVLSLLGLSGLGMNSNMEEMLPADSEALKASEQFNQYFDTQESGIVVVQGESVLCESFLIDLEQRILESELPANMFYRLDTTELERNRLLYIDTQTYEDLEKHIEAMDYKAIQKSLERLSAQAADSSEIEYLANDEQDTYLMVVKPYLNMENYVESRQQFYDTVTHSIAQTLTDTRYKELVAGLTGGVFIQDIEADAVAFEGMGPTFFVTLLLIVLLIVFSFRRILLPLSIVYPLLLGVCTAAAIAWIIYSSLNMFSVSFALLLIGLGIDFSIHLITRYDEERGKELSVAQATALSLEKTGTAILIGALTTALAFLAFVFARFKALEQMGIISSLGVVVLCLLMLLMVPALIQLTESKKRPKTFKKRDFKFLFVLGEGTARRPWVVVALFAVIIGVLFFNVRDTRIVGDIDKIYPSDIESKKWEAVLTASFDYDPNILTFVAEDEETLGRYVNELSGRDGIALVNSALDYLPADQDYKLNVLNRLSMLLKHIGSPFASQLSADKMGIADLPESIRSNYVGKKGRLLVEVVPSINVYQQENFQLVKDAIYEVSGNIPIGMPAIMNEVMTMVGSDIIIICLICFGIIIVFLFLAFRSVKHTVICVLPVVLTLYLTVGILPLLGSQINVFSIGALPLLIGIGIDSSIHLMHRFRSDTQNNIGTIVMHTGKAVILTSLTTLLGFGSLIFINHPGMAGLGALVAIGMVINLIMTLTFLPAVFVLTRGRAKTKDDCQSSLACS